MNIKDFIFEFESLKSKTESYGSTMSRDILANRRLKSANISESQQQLARATIVGDLTYDAMKLKLTRIFDESVNSPGFDSETVAIKSESNNEAAAYESDEIFYAGNPRGKFYGQNPNLGIVERLT